MRGNEGKKGRFATDKAPSKRPDVILFVCRFCGKEKPIEEIRSATRFSHLWLLVEAAGNCLKKEAVTNKRAWIETWTILNLSRRLLSPLRVNTQRRRLSSKIDLASIVVIFLATRVLTIHNIHK